MTVHYSISQYATLLLLSLRHYYISCIILLSNYGSVHYYMDPWVIILLSINLYIILLLMYYIIIMLSVHYLYLMSIILLLLICTLRLGSHVSQLLLLLPSVHYRAKSGLVCTLLLSAHKFYLLYYIPILSARGYSISVAILH